MFRLGTLRAAVNGVSRIGAGGLIRECPSHALCGSHERENVGFLLGCGAVRLALCCCPLNVSAVHVVRSAAHMNVKNVGFCRVTRFFGSLTPYI